MEEIGYAREVLIASFLFDHAALQEALLRRLNGRGEFDLQVLVDRAAFVERTAYRQRPRLDALRRASASVYLCSGDPPLGAFHAKVAVLDRRICFTGSANFTQKSLQNFELTLRLVGPQVLEILRDVEAARLRGRLWDGSL